MAKILLVEDETDLREAMQEEISEEGYEVEIAINGLKAFEILANYTPDVILSDITMPEMDGLELLRNVREKYTHLDETPFLFLSALNEKEDIIKGKKLGADDYLVKPVDFDLLFATLETRLGQVERMKHRKEKQFVKLYQALKGPSAQQPEPASAAQPLATEPTSNPEHVTDHEEPLDLGAGNKEAHPQVPGEEKVYGRCLHFEELMQAFDRLNKNKDLRLNEFVGESIKGCVPEQVEVDISTPGMVMIYNADDELTAKDRNYFEFNLQKQIFESGFGEVIIDNFSKIMASKDLRVRDLTFDMPLSQEQINSGKSNSIRDYFFERFTDRVIIKQMFKNIQEEGSLVQAKFEPCDDKVKEVNFFHFDKNSEAILKTAYAFCDPSIRKALEFQRDMVFLNLASEYVANAPSNSIVAIDVHYDTLSKPEKVPQYRKRFEKEFPKIKCKLYLNVRGLPNTPDLAKCVSAITSIAVKKAGWMVQFNPWLDNGVDASQLKVPFVTWSAEDIYGANLFLEPFEKLKAAYKLCGGSFLLRDLPAGVDRSVIEDGGFNGFSINNE